MAAPGKQYGLILPKKLLQKPAFLPKHSAFADDSDEETAVGSRLQKEALKKKVMKQTKLEMQKALEQDATVYEYDSVYDDMQKKKVENSTAQMLAVKERKPKYIQSLLQAVEVRKKEQEKRMEKMIQKEREAEGVEFEDKEAFVTTAYKKKLEERALEEDLEKRESAIEASLDVTKQKDLSGFYRHLLNQTVGEEQAPECSLRDSRVKEEKPKGYSDEAKSPNHNPGEQNGAEDTVKEEQTPDPQVNMEETNKHTKKMDEPPESHALPEKEGGRDGSVSSEDDTKGHHIQRQSRSSSEEKDSHRADKHSHRESKKSHKKEKVEGRSSSKKEKQHRGRNPDKNECSNQQEKDRHRDKGERHRHSDHGSKRDEAEGKSRKKKDRKRDKEREDKHSERERQKNGKDQDRGEKHKEREEKTNEEKRERPEKERKRHDEHEEIPQSTRKEKETVCEGETVKETAPVQIMDMMESRELDDLDKNDKNDNGTEKSTSNPERESELKRKDEETEGEEMVENKSKFAKRSNEETVLSARDRYLARQMARVSTKSYIEKEED